MLNNLSNLSSLNLELKHFTTPKPSLPQPIPSPPIPPSSCANGMPEISKAKEICLFDPLSGPKSRHAEYIFSRVEGEGGLLSPEEYMMGYSSAVSSPICESFETRASPLPGLHREKWGGRGCGAVGERGHGLDWDLESSSNTEMNMGMDQAMRTEINTRMNTASVSPSPWKILEKSRREVSDGAGIETQIYSRAESNQNRNRNRHQSLNLAKCEERFTGRENGNRSFFLMDEEIEHGYMGVGNEDLLRGYDGWDASQDQFRYCGRCKDEHGNGNGNGTRMIRTKSEESFVEILLDDEEDRDYSSQKRCGDQAQDSAQHSRGMQKQIQTRGRQNDGHNTLPMQQHDVQISHLNSSSSSNSYSNTNSNSIPNCHCHSPTMCPPANHPKSVLYIDTWHSDSNFNTRTSSGEDGDNDTSTHTHTTPSKYENQNEGENEREQKRRLRMQRISKEREDRVNAYTYIYADTNTHAHPWRKHQREQMKMQMGSPILIRDSEYMYMEMRPRAKRSNENRGTGRK